MEYKHFKDGCVLQLLWLLHQNEKKIPVCHDAVLLEILLEELSGNVLYIYTHYTYAVFGCFVNDSYYKAALFL